MKQVRILGEWDAEGRQRAVALSPSAARELLFISRHGETDAASTSQDKMGYQRPPNAKRFSKIGAYYSENPDRVTTLEVSVRLSDQNEIEHFFGLLEEENFAAIKKNFGKQVCSVMDGQHRWLGIDHVYERSLIAEEPLEITIPAMFRTGLSFEEEAGHFADINNEQKRMDTSLVSLTKARITEQHAETYDQRIRELTMQMCSDDDSPWKDRMNLSGIRDSKRPVTYEGARRSVVNMFPRDFFDRLRGMDPNLPLNLAKRYWNAVVHACPSAWENERVVLDDGTSVVPRYQLTALVGIASVSKLGADILKTHIESSVDDKLEELTEKLVDVNWIRAAGNPWMSNQVDGFAGQKEMYSMLYRWVYSGISPLDA